MNRRCGFVLGVLFVVGLACSSADLVVGDDTSLGGADASAEAAIEDGGEEPDVAFDTGQDAPNACIQNGGTCLEKDAGCRDAATSGCTTASALCCLDPCPNVAAPSPTSCDGGPPLAKRDSYGCITEYACGPLACAEGGGSCVALAPGTCPNGHYANAAEYSCGPGLGVTCCLP